MSQKQIKRIRKQAHRIGKQYASEHGKAFWNYMALLPLRERVVLAWRLACGKMFKD